MPIKLCDTSEIPDPGSLGIDLTINGETVPIFIVHKDASVTAYLNSCPHTGVNLEWQENRFLDADDAFIQCSTHDALFDITTGECIVGPCVGEHLTLLPVSIEDGYIVLPESSLAR